MIDWIARNWCDQWLANLMWWQSFAALLQCASAILILWVTHKYMKLTRDLVQAGIDPVVELSLPGSEEGLTASFALTIGNVGAVDVVNLTTQCRVFSRRRTVNRESAQHLKYTQHLAPGSFKEQHFERIGRDCHVKFFFGDSVGVASASRRERQGTEPGVDIDYKLVFQIRYQRPYDRRRYERTKRVDIRWNSANEPFLLRSDLLEEPPYSD